MTFGVIARSAEGATKQSKLRLLRSLRSLAMTLLAFCSLSSVIYAADFNTEDAKRQYRAYLEQLKQLNQQYKQITGQIAQVVKEEGLPTWEKAPAEAEISKMVTAAYGDSRVHQTDKEIRVYLELPGLLRNTMKVALETPQTLRVTAQKRVAEDVANVDQKIDLPAAAIEKGAKAKYADGVLEITLPKDAPRTTTAGAIPIY